MSFAYQETLRYLYENLPMFQRVGAVAYKADLDNTLKLCDRLGNPQRQFKCVHIAGTNGKGSTSHMLASILQSSGYKTGLYTSPHLKEFTERIRLNGKEVSQEFVVDFVERIKPSIEEIKPSFFEITVAMAFDYFARQKADVAVIEVGLGGRLDSTNVIVPEISVITNIGWDHKDILGDTLEKIAFEKAGIIKPKIPVVISERQPAVEKVFTTKAHETRSTIYFASDEYVAVPSVHRGSVGYDILKDSKKIYANLEVPLQGSYQRKNLPGVLKAIEVLHSKGWKITHDSIREGLTEVIRQTNLKGRWQILSEKPLMICDTGHNLDGVREVVAQIAAQHYEHLHIVWGMVKDKDIADILAILPKQANYYFCQAKIPRAMDAAQLAEQASKVGLKGEIVPDVNQAIQAANEKATDRDFIFVGGSTFVVADIEGL